MTSFRSIAFICGRASLLAAALALSACRSTPEAPPPAHSTPQPPAEATRSASPDFAVVYFDYDSASLKSDASAILKKNAELLKTSDETVTLEGFCDERGSEEYNLALGERRAEAVRSYLVNLGVPAAQLRVVSFGEAKPAVMGHDEAAWKWNRRVETH